MSRISKSNGENMSNESSVKLVVVIGFILSSIVLCAWIPFSKSNFLSSLSIALSLVITALAIGHAIRALTRAAKLLVTMVWVIQLCLFILSRPLAEPHPKNQAELAILSLMTLSAIVVRLSAARLSKWAETASGWVTRHPVFEGLAGSAVILLAVMAGGEFIASQVAHTGLLRFDQPMMTLYQGREVEDWRRHHITQDSYRVPDPVLMWKPVNHYPYNSKGFKGAELDERKPKFTFRILAVGDSNTDGPDRGGWPEELEKRLNLESGSNAYEVINAGVAGYSSLQGLRRLEDYLRYQPDLVLVSFGCNDAHLVETADKEFTVTSAAFLRILFRYKSVLFVRYISAKLLHQTPANKPHEPRVSLDDYEKNLRRMAELVRSSDGKIAFLTRPYDPAVLLRSPEHRWVHRAPAYRHRTLQAGKQLSVPVFDAYTAFQSGGVELFVDESHFTRLGHLHMAAILTQFLSEHQLIKREVESS